MKKINHNSNETHNNLFLLIIFQNNP